MTKLNIARRSKDILHFKPMRLTNRDRDKLKT